MRKGPEQPKNSENGKIYFLCNSEQKAIFPKPIIPIYTLESFKKISEEQNQFQNNTYGIIILLEIKWENRYYTDFLGLDLIYQIRVILSLDIPIILTSHYPDLDHKGLKFKDFDKNGYQYLQDPSLKFITFSHLLKKTVKEIRTTFQDPINDSLFFDDLKENLYFKSGYLDSFLNSLLNELENIYSFNKSGKNIKDGLRKNLFSIRGILEHREILGDLFTLVRTTFKDDQDYSKKEVAEIIHKIKAILQDQYRTIPITSIPDNINTVYLQSVPNINSNLNRSLAPYGIDCHIPKSTQAVFQLIKEKSIQVILCDFRFYDKNNQFSRNQGYHIIENIQTTLPNIYFFIVLTNYKIPMIPRFFKNLNNLVIVEKWHTRDQNGLAKLAQLIIEKDTQIKNEKIRLPNFNKAMSLYVRHCEKEDYKIAEKDISDFSLSIINKILKGDNDLPSLSGTKGLLDGQDMDKNLKNFRIKLKARRLALGLFQVTASKLDFYRNAKEHWSIICSIIQNGSKNKHDTQTALFMSRHLFGLKTKTNYNWESADLLQLTPGERNWLIKYGEDIEQDRLNL